MQLRNTNQHHHHMKKFLPFLASLLLTSVGWGQTGTGVVLLTEESHTFTPTTVDSTSVFNFQLQNTVGVSQTIYFGGLDAPFQLSESMPIELDSMGLADLSIAFTPELVGTFSDTLEVIGSIFGSAEVVVTGDGIQVSFEWSADSLLFETTPIGQTDTQSLSLASVGDGAAVIGNFEFSNDIFSVDSLNSDLNVAEGATGTLSITFAPTGAGVFEESVTFETNDPNNQFVTLTLQATSISEVSGEVCNAVWSLADSPFTLVGDVVVPEGCVLTIEPGVEVNGNGYKLEIAGQLIATGGIQQPIDINNTALIGTEAEMSLSHVHFSSSDSLTDITLGTSPYVGIMPAEFNSEPSDVYHEDFENYLDGENGLFNCDNTSSGSDYTSNSTSGANGCTSFLVRDIETYSHSGTQSFYWDSYNYSADLYYETPIVVPEAGSYYLSHALKIEFLERNNEFFSFYRVNGGSWIEFYRSPSGDYENYAETSSQLDQIVGVALSLNEGDVIELFFRNYISSTSSCYDRSRVYIDDIRLSQSVGDSSLKGVAYTTSGNWNYNSEFYDDGWAVGCESCYNYDVSGNSEYVEFRTRGCSTCGNDEWIESPLIDITQFGLAQFEWQEYIPSTYYYWRPRVQASVNGGDYFDIYLRDLSYCESYIYDDYSAWYNRIATVGSVEVGDQVRIRFNPFQNQGNSWDFYIRLKDLELFTVPVGLYTGEVSSEFLKAGDVLLTDCDLHPMSNLDFDSTSLFIAENSAHLAIESSDINELRANVDSLTLASSTIATSSVETDILEVTATHLGALESSTLSAHFATSEVASWSGMNAMIVIADTEMGPISNSEFGQLTATSSEFESIDMLNGGSIALANVEITGATGDGIRALGSSTSLIATHTKVSGASDDGIDISSYSGLVNLSNCIIADNGGRGIYSNVPANISYVTVADNGSTAIVKGSAPSQFGFEVTNSILSLNGGTTSGAMLTEFNYTENYPQFADSDYHLESYSPAVDAAMPWHTDQNMPYGMGGLRADMGAYGGPDNAGWGGEAAPSGSASISSVDDSPQDQGNLVGIAFDASAFDNSVLEANITHYSFWRHYDPTGQSIASLNDGNWELIGDMPAQSFDGYAYQAATLGNTNVFGEFNSCYTVVAHTADEDTYWYSNVMCGQSEDNLAPADPEVGGMVLETGGTTVFWETPAEEDYAYTLVTGDFGFNAEVVGDTATVDLTAEAEGLYTYTATHFDVNGNASAPVSVSIEVEAGSDVIQLQAGWNLISTDRAVDQPVADVFAGLEAGNLQYVTGFEGGVQFYDPSGLSFLNTLSTLTPGKGYWVKVAEDDVLEVSGTRLSEDFQPSLTEGWNLVGYAAEASQAPEEVYADMIADGTLLYITGFDGGVQVFDPNGLSFLNTLTELRNGYGYWVKSAVTTSGDVLSNLNDGASQPSLANPRYDVLNGVSNLASFAGQQVDVLNAQGEVVGTLDILEGGHLMTEAIYGDDPETTTVEGVSDGEVLRFFFGGLEAQETMTFGGNMGHKSLSLTFKEDESRATVFPNPATDQAQVTLNLVDADVVSFAMVDVLGRETSITQDVNVAEGASVHVLDLSSLAPGVYTLHVKGHSGVVTTEQISIKR